MEKLPGSMASYFAKAILICGCMRLAGQAPPTATWTGGGGDSNWGNASNWSWQGDNGQCKDYAPGTIPTLPGNICYAPNVVIPGKVAVNENNVLFVSEINNFSIGEGSVLSGGNVDTEGNVMVASDAFVNGAVSAHGSGGVLTNQGTIIGGVLAATITNSGTIKLVGAVGQAYATAQGTNTGTIEATGNGSSLGVQGASTLQGPWNNANGTIQVDSGATLVCNSATVIGGSFNVSDGGTVTTSGNGLTLAGTVNSTSFVIDVVGSLGTAPVTITGALLIAGNLTVGNTTGVSTLSVSSGGALNVTGGNTILGAQAGATGQLEISGTSALKTTTGNLIIGAAGTGYVAVSGGADVTARSITLGSAPSGSGQLNVNGSVVNYATLNAQRSTANPAVWVYGGGTLVGQANQTIGGAPADFLGASALITTSGSAWKPQSGLTIQAAGSLTVSLGGAVNVTCPSCMGTTNYAFQANANSIVNIFGTNSALTVAGDLGLSAGATLTVESAAMAYSPKVIVRGTAIVQGMDSLLTATQQGTDSASGSIYIVDAGTLTVLNQGQVRSDSIALNGPTATMTAQSSGGVKTNNLDVFAGGALIQNAGYLVMPVGAQEAPYGFISVGDHTWPGVLTVSDSADLSGAGNVVVAKNGTLRITNGDSVTIFQGLGGGHVSMLPGTPPAMIDVSKGALGIGNVSPLSTKDQDTVPRGVQPTLLRQGWVVVGTNGYLSGGEICNATSSGATSCTPNTLVNTSGQLLVNGSVANEGGTVLLDPTTLNITQDFQQSSGTLDLQMQGTQSGEFDRITAGGSIQITGGTVEFDFINGFAPSSGDKFNLLSAPGGISTSGASLTTTGLAAGFKYTTSASSGQFDLTATDSGTATTSAPAPPPAPTLTSVDAASGATQLAPGSLASGYGAGLATGQPASAPYIWPTTINGTSVSIVDATGATTEAPLLYVSSTEVNYQIPDTVGLGPATVTVTTGDGTTKSGPINVVSYAPGLFAVNSAGLSASFADCVAANGAQTTIPTSQVVNGALVAVPLNLKACQQTILELWTTGLDEAEASMVQATIGGLDATVLYAGPQGVYPGVDQINVVIPQSLAGAGNVPIVVSAGGVTSNTVNVTFQ